jgi:hypothetical protein
MQPSPADRPTVHPRVDRHISDRESLAEHKFNQKKIMAMAARRDLVVQYFRRQWTFIEPFNMKAYVRSLSDKNAISWLSSIPYPRKAGSLEEQ